MLRALLHAMRNLKSKVSRRQSTTTTTAVIASHEQGTEDALNVTTNFPDHISNTSGDNIEQSHPRFLSRRLCRTLSRSFKRHNRKDRIHRTDSEQTLIPDAELRPRRNTINLPIWQSTNPNNNRNYDSVDDDRESLSINTQTPTSSLMQQEEDEEGNNNRIQRYWRSIQTCFKSILTQINIHSYINEVGNDPNNWFSIYLYIYVMW